MMLPLLLAIVFAVVEGDPLSHPPSLHLLHLYNDHPLSHDLLNDISQPHPSYGTFRYLLHGNDHRLEPLLKAMAPGDAGDSVNTPIVSRQHPLPSGSSDYSIDEGLKVEDVMVDADAMESFETAEGKTAPLSKRRVTTAKKDPSAPYQRRNSRDEPHRRQKRFILGNKLRTIAVPLSVFNFLGFLPVRVPGLPYHNELPSPDYSYYNTMYEIYVPRKRRRFRFYN